MATGSRDGRRRRRGGAPRLEAFEERVLLSIIPEPPLIGDRAFLDLNGNGIQDPDDPGIGGIPVSLFETIDPGAPRLVGQATTDADGFYFFGGISNLNMLPGELMLPGTSYKVVFDTSGPEFAELSPTIPKAPGSTDENDSDIDAAGVIEYTTPDPPEDTLDLDAGYVAPGSVGGFVYEDANDDGIKQPTEIGVPGVTVRLIDDSTSAVIATTTTAADGSYRFSGLSPGVYTVGYDFGTRPPAFADHRDGRDTPGRMTIQALGTTIDTGISVSDDDNLITRISTPSTGVGNDYNFGIVPPEPPPPPRPASISGRVFVDNNNNGVQDPGDVGIPGVPITLRNETTGQTRTTSTNGQGDYFFDNLPGGRYSVSHGALPPGFQNLLNGRDLPGVVTLDGVTTPSGTSVSDLDDIITGIELPPGSAGTRYDFAAFPPGSVSGQVFVDENDDCVRDPGEAPLAGVTITLFRDEGNGALTFVATTTTDANGQYAFANLPPGVYSVVQTQPEGFEGTGAAAGSPAGVPGPNRVDQILVGAGTVGVGYDFCERVPTPPPNGGTPPGGSTVFRTGFHNQPTFFTVVFDRPVDPTQATDPSNYILVSAGLDNRFGTADDRTFRFSSATLSPDGTTVTLTPAAGRLHLHRRYQLVANGTNENAIRGIDGTILDGDGDGVPGGDLSVILLPRDTSNLPPRHRPRPPRPPIGHGGGVVAGSTTTRNAKVGHATKTTGPAARAGSRKIAGLIARSTPGAGV